MRRTQTFNWYDITATFAKLAFKDHLATVYCLTDICNSLKAHLHSAPTSHMWLGKQMLNLSRDLLMHNKDNLSTPTLKFTLRLNP
jgi:hypothetical protein